MDPGAIEGDFMMSKSFIMPTTSWTALKFLWLLINDKFMLIVKDFVSSYNQDFKCLSSKD